MVFNFASLKMNQAFVFNSINNIEQLEYVTAISKIIPVENNKYTIRTSYLK